MLRSFAGGQGVTSRLSPSLEVFRHSRLAIPSHYASPRSFSERLLKAVERALQEGVTGRVKREFQLVCLEEFIEPLSTAPEYLVVLKRRSTL
jgi:hypothetical protein